MKLSIVILCWNDWKVISGCLQSIYAESHCFDFEVIVADNGSTDDTVERIREAFPQVRIVENGMNLRFAKGNNPGIQASQGEYILILNPDTILHPGSLNRWMEFADRHPEAGGFGCRVLNADGSYQGPARPFPTSRGDWIAALYLRWLAYLSDYFTSDVYVRWKGDSERTIDWQSGCCLLVRGELLRRLGGFDGQFSYYYEDMDLCHQIWDSGHPIVYTPDVAITHLGGQSTTWRYPVAFELDKYRNRYRYYYKYFGDEGVRRCRRSSLAWIWVRLVGYSLGQLIKPSDAVGRRLNLYKVAAQWNRQVDPVRLVENGEEPQISLHSTATLPQ
jgi:GT2 family glycosyltransferase